MLRGLRRLRRRIRLIYIRTFRVVVKCDVCERPATVWIVSKNGGPIKRSCDAHWE